MLKTCLRNFFFIGSCSRQACYPFISAHFTLRMYDQQQCRSLQEGARAGLRQLQATAYCCTLCIQPVLLSWRLCTKFAEYIRRFATFSSYSLPGPSKCRKCTFGQNSCLEACKKIFKGTLPPLRALRGIYFL